MSEFVCDASVALKWVVNEPLSAEALRLREDFRNGVHRLIAPDIFRVEVGHVLSKLHRQRTLTEIEAEAALVEVLTTTPDLQDSLPLFPRAFELALQSKCSLYDCIYVALCERSGSPPVTADQRLMNTFGSPANMIHLSKF
jgi:predicted nucleic acid-binding protein